MMLASWLKREYHEPDRLDGESCWSDGLVYHIPIIALFLVFRFKINSAWLILGGGLLGMAYKLVWVDIGGDTF
jgi:hypothetical protein